MDSERSAAFRLLGIPADSDREAVARAYHRLARATHPDVSADPEAAHRFALLAAAYRLVRDLPSDVDAEPALAVRPERHRPSAPPGRPDDRGAPGWLWAVDPDRRAPSSWRRPAIVAGPVRVRPSTRVAGQEAGDG